MGRTVGCEVTAGFSDKQASRTVSCREPSETVRDKHRFQEGTEDAQVNGAEHSQILLQTGQLLTPWLLLRHSGEHKNQTSGRNRGKDQQSGASTEYSRYPEQKHPLEPSSPSSRRDDLPNSTINEPGTSGQSQEGLGQQGKTSSPSTARRPAHTAATPELPPGVRSHSPAPAVAREEDTDCWARLLPDHLLSPALVQGPLTRVLCPIFYQLEAVPKAA